MDPVAEELRGARHRADPTPVPTEPTDGPAEPTEPRDGPAERVLGWIGMAVGWVWAVAERTPSAVKRARAAAEPARTMAVALGRRIRQRLARNRWARTWYRWIRRPTHARVDRPPPLTGHRVAERLSELLAPVILISATALLTGLNTADSLLAGVGWAAVTVLFCAVIPEARAWLGSWRDEHVSGAGVRAHRRRPITFGLAPMVVGLALLLLFGAPRELVALMVSMLGTLHAVAAVRRLRGWRPSAHAAVASGCATAMVAVFGPVLLIGYAVPVAAGWSRVTQGERTAAEAVAGAGLGVLVTAPVFALIA